ncbi:MAG: hypothetical protein NTV43_08190 [Methylococcales bacterium]|nr:hypothetical protein [Methylococcales bacterium]
MTLSVCLKTVGLRDLDFSDDRLYLVLDRLGRDDAAWESYGSKQTATFLRAYDLKALRVRVDSTTAKTYVAVTENGLFQFGHSKQHRPDLPQLKINMAVLDPLGPPPGITTVSGECADEPCMCRKYAKCRPASGGQGVLYVGWLFFNQNVEKSALSTVKICCCPYSLANQTNDASVKSIS